MRRQGFAIPINEAKENVRRLENGAKKKALLGVEGDPHILVTHDNRVLLAVPCREIAATGSGSRGRDGYVACARFDERGQILARQIELFCAAGEALARLIEEDDVRGGTRSGPGEEGADEGDDRPARARHPRGSFKDILTIDSDLIKVIKMVERAATTGLA